MNDYTNIGATTLILDISIITDEELLQIYLCDKDVKEFEILNLETKQKLLAYLRYILDDYNKLRGLHRAICYSPEELKLKMNLEEFLDFANDYYNGGNTN